LALPVTLGLYLERVATVLEEPTGRQALDPRLNALYSYDFGQHLSTVFRVPYHFFDDPLFAHFWLVGLYHVEQYFAQ
jgi:hypothetical protein